MHFLVYLFTHFISLHVSSIKCSSSGDRIVLIHHLVWLVCVSDCLVCPPDPHTKQSLTQTNRTRWCISTIRSPDDEHLMLQTCRETKWINKYTKKCIRLVINRDQFLILSIMSLLLMYKENTDSLAYHTFLSGRYNVKDTEINYIVLLCLHIQKSNRNCVCAQHASIWIMDVIRTWVSI